MTTKTQRRMVLQDLALLLDGARGIYIPRDFAKRFDMSAWGIEPYNADILMSGPDHAEYWDTWDYVLSTASYTMDGVTWRLYQDGDLWASNGNVMDE